MKKCMLFLAVTALCLSLIACKATSETENTESTNKSNTTESQVASTTDMDELPSHVEYPLLQLSSFEEYEDFINTTENIPDNFVYYEAISQFGDFKELIILSNTLVKDYSSYLYSFVDSSGFEVSLYVENIDEDSAAEKNIIMSIDGTDMRVLSTESPGVCEYFQGALEYTYISGKLLSVEWIQNGLEFALYADSLHQYPYNESTLTGKLLNAELASDAYSAYIAPITE